MNITGFSNNFTQNNYQNRNNLKFGQILKNVAQDTIKNNDKVACVISGPSGVGKGTIVGAFRILHPDFFTDSVSCATRAPRPGEKDGVQYNFLSVDEFKNGIDNNEFIEYNEVYPGKFYGTRVSDVEKAFNKAPKNVMLELDVDGAQTAKQKLKKSGYPVVTIFITPDSIDRLESHLSKRGTETPETIKDRVGRAKYEISQSDKYDVIIQNNDDVEENVNDLNNVFNLSD